MLNLTNLLTINHLPTPRIYSNLYHHHHHLCEVYDVTEQLISKNSELIKLNAKCNNNLQAYNKIAEQIIADNPLIKESYINITPDAYRSPLHSPS